MRGKIALFSSELYKLLAFSYETWASAVSAEDESVIEIGIKKLQDRLYCCKISVFLFIEIGMALVLLRCVSTALHAANFSFL